MKKVKYIFDEAEANARKAGVGLRLWALVKNFLILVAVTLSLTVIMYFLISLFVSTDMEKKMAAENRMYSRNYEDLKYRTELLGGAITGLQVKDYDIYESIFHTDAPRLDPISYQESLFGNDTVPDYRTLKYTAAKADSLLAKSSVIEERFREIYALVEADSSVVPPMCLPLENISYTQFGATTGRRISPFLKAYVDHTGLDLIASQETPVYAGGPGLVTSVVRSAKGSGNVVEITHEGGYVTRYAHLLAASVRKGQYVKAGTRVGSVGMSGNSFAPHLHFEVLKDGEYMDPMGYIFLSVPPQEYANMLFMAITTEQSMD